MTAGECEQLDLLLSTPENRLKSVAQAHYDVYMVLCKRTVALLAANDLRGALECVNVACGALRVYESKRASEVVGGEHSVIDEDPTTVNAREAWRAQATHREEVHVAARKAKARELRTRRTTA